jgi:FkbM family methyltransferase
MLLANLKTLMPTQVRRPLGKLRAVARRLRVWRQVSNRITGADEASRSILKKAVRKSVFTVWRDLDSWQFPMVEQNCTVLSEGAGRFLVRAWTDDLFHVLPGQEPAVETAIRSALRPGDVFVDAGANIGYYTIIAAKIVGPKGRVLACEMMPLTADILRAHVEMNAADNVTVIEGALAEVEGETLMASHPDGKFGQASIARGDQGSGVAVRTRRLEVILEEVPMVRIMKMDLEGAELGALRGLGAAISKVKAIVIENRGDPEVLRFLADQGFELSRIDGNNVIAQQRQIRG